MAKKSFPLSKVYTLIESGPVVLLSTMRGDRSNIMAMSWHTMIEFVPPLIGCIISDRNYSFGSIKAAKECVINIPTVEIAEKAVGCGNTSGKKVNKFEKFGLTQKHGSHVSAPLIDECYANLECRVVDTGMASKYGMFIFEVTKAWIDPAAKNPRTIHHLGGVNFMVAGERIMLKSKLK